LILFIDPAAIQPVRGTHHLRENESALTQDEATAGREAVQLIL